MVGLLFCPLCTPLPLSLPPLAPPGLVLPPTTDEVKLVNMMEVVICKGTRAVEEGEDVAVGGVDTVADEVAVVAAMDDTVDIIDSMRVKNLSDVILSEKLKKNYLILYYIIRYIKEQAVPSPTLWTAGIVKIALHGQLYVFLSW